MNVAQAKQTARAWVAANAGQRPGLRAAHLVGGITTMPDGAPFPIDKDVDVHLIFAEGSPALQATNPFASILEAHVGGVAIEAGLKSVADHRSPAVVLANPEIAHHLTVDSVLYDPRGLLRELQAEVRREYPRRRWVLARIDHERRGAAAALGMRAMAGEAWGAAGELNILGWSTTYAAAALWVAALHPPRMGGRMFLRVRELLADHGRLDLYEELASVLGLDRLDLARVEWFLRETIQAFDVAVEIVVTPQPFGHKLHRHLRPYFVETCRGLLAEGNHREALAWLTPYAIATAGVVLADGPADLAPEKARFAALRDDLLRALGLDTAPARDAAFARAARLYERVFAFAEEIADRHPGVVD